MSQPQEIKINRPLATHLLSLAQKSPTLEVCGLVSAIANKPTTVYPIKNIASNNATEFEIDPQQQIRVFATIKEKGEELFAIYHSHPQSKPVPSNRDLMQQGYPDIYQLIISLNTKGVLEMRAYKISDGEYEEVNISV